MYNYLSNNNPLAAESCAIKFDDQPSYMSLQTIFVNSLVMVTNAIVKSLEHSLKERAMQNSVFRDVVEKYRPDVLMYMIENLMSSSGIDGNIPHEASLLIGYEFRKLTEMRLLNTNLVDFINKFNGVIDKIHTLGYNPSRYNGIENTVFISWF